MTGNGRPTVHCSPAAVARPAIGDVAALATARQPARVRDLGVRLLYVFVANTCLIGTYDFFSMVPPVCEL
eukprot:COSAG06_NODE_19118_length_852_cov_3.687915_1_plen_70_part_00